MSAKVFVVSEVKMLLIPRTLMDKSAGSNFEIKDCFNLKILSKKAD